MVLAHFPPEIVEEILCRIPLESLLLLRETCRAWNACTRNSYFIAKHRLHNPEKRFLRIHNDSRVEILNPITGILLTPPLPSEFLSVEKPIMSMVECDGFMLCKCAGIGKTYLAIWNPLLFTTRWIDASFAYQDTDCFGMGYAHNSAGKRYAVIKFLSHHDAPLNIVQENSDDDEQDLVPVGDAANEDGPDVEIFEFGINLWRRLDLFVEWSLDSNSSGVSLAGNMYWIGTVKGKSFIMKFDFSIQRFEKICECPISRVSCLSSYSGDQLCLLLQNEDSTNMELLVTNKLSDDGLVSFSRYWKVTHHQLPVLQYDSWYPPPCFCIGHHKNILAWSEIIVEEFGHSDYVISLSDIDGYGLKSHTETGRNGGCYFPSKGYLYVPSLLPLPEKELTLDEGSLKGYPFDLSNPAIIERSFTHGSASAHHWHYLEIGPEAPAVFNCLVEFSKGDEVSKKLDKNNGLMKVDHVYSSIVIVYPQNYCFIPQTLCENNGPMNVLVLTQEPMLTGSLLRARAIGLMRMIYQGKKDDKIIAVRVNDPEFQRYRDITGLPLYRLAEIRRFFEDYKKNVDVEDFLPAQAAIDAIKDSMDLYAGTFRQGPLR